MKIVAKLFGLTCVSVFVFAAAMSLIGADNVDLIQNKLSDKKETISSKSENNENSADNLSLKQEDKMSTPNSYKIADLNQKLLPYEFESVEQIKELLAKNIAVTVFLDNQYAKNPFLPEEQVFMVKLIGYSDTHFFSDGAEVSANEFVYLISDFIQVLENSKSKIWY